MASNQYRKKAFDRHGRECQDCGDTSDLEVHHVDRDRDNNDPENLEVLCHDCHWDRHRDGFSERMSGPRGSPNARKAGGGQSDGFMREADWQLVDELREGRANAPLLAERTGYSAQYIRERLGRLKQDDIVVPLGHGIYEVNEDEVPPKVET